MSNQDVHVRAEQLIARDFVEGISESEQAWLDRHLRECEKCSAVSTATNAALRSLKGVAIAVPTDLARVTQFRVRLRAQQQVSAAPRRRMLWIACGVSWVFGVVTAPLVWRGLQAAAVHFSLTSPLPEMAFGLWWALPAIVAGAIVLAENARWQRERDVADGRE
jgi:hypothetical protein